MNIPSSSNSQTYSATSIEKDLKELIQMMYTWPTWKIDSLQNDNRNISSSQILRKELVITPKK